MWRLTVLLFFVLSASAREMPIEDDGPEQQEEVMPITPTVEPTPTTQTTPPNRKWAPTDFPAQPQAMGWSPDAFQTPASMQERVQFWIDIYTKYTSDQGVLHDSKYITMIYETVNFTDITLDTSLNDKQKEKARLKRVKERKLEIAGRLKRLQNLKDPAAIDSEDKRYLDLFAKIDEPHKFVDAAGRKRLRFQLGQRNQIASGITQSGRYLKQMEEIFREEGLPVELTRLPFVESSFNLHARSRVGASGLWQFMKSTARAYLRMDNSADERNDPLRATRAAAKKLRDNFLMLKSWPLAITAYNRGPSGVRRLTEKLGTTDITEIIDVRKGRFGFAGANFYANFLAALTVEHNADKYFGSLEVLPELKGAEVEMIKSQYAREFLNLFNDDLALAQLLNPHVSEAVWENKIPLTKKQMLRVPNHT